MHISRKMTRSTFRDGSQRITARASTLFLLAFSCVPFTPSLLSGINGEFGHQPLLLAHASSYADGGTDMACWKAKLMVPCDTIFPGVEILVDWSSLEDKKLVEGDMISIPSHMIIPDTLNLTTTTFKDHGFGIDHTNLHACKPIRHATSPAIFRHPIARMKMILTPIQSQYHFLQSGRVKPSK